MASTSRYDANKVCCDSHPDAPLIEDYRAGDQICSECGLVVGDRVIDVGSEWRTFSNEKNGVDPSRVGGPENPLLGGSDLTTIIGPGRGDASFDSFGVARYQNRRTMNSSDRALINAFKEINAMADRINLPRTIVDRANNLFKQVHDGRNLKGRSNDAIASACLYIACRQEGVPRTFKEICAVSKISKREIGRCFKLILKALATSVDLITTGDFMSRFCANLGLPNMVQRAAAHIARKAVEIDIVPGRSPISVAAAAIYMASQVIVISFSASVVVVGVLARYFRRKKRVVDPAQFRKNIFSSKRSRVSGIRSPNGDLGSIASSGKRSAAFSNVFGEKYTRQGSVAASGKASIASGSLASTGLPIPEGIDAANLTPQQLGVMGMEALETCIGYWEDALATYRSKDGALTVLSPEEAGFCKDLQQILELALDLQEHSEMLFLDERSVLFRSESGTKDGAKGVDLSEGESFASAQDQVADLTEFEEFSEYFPDLEAYPLYQTALRQLENGGIPCRTLRTELVRCGSDGEYLAKLHCLRLAFQHLLRDQINYIWFVEAGRQILVDLLLYADKDAKDFIIGYEEMLRYIEEPSNWRELEEELSARGVKALTFYDVVLDYILMDAFEDLDSPPSSVMAVIQNRWLSNGFKETALTTAVWSVLKAKKKRLKFSAGFMAHFYTLSEQLSPLLAWGFLGSDELLKETCVYFKEQVIEFLADIFNFHKCKYTSVDNLAVDVLRNIKIRVDNICQRLSAQS